MHTRVSAVAAATIVAIGAISGSSAAGPARAQVLFHLADPRIDEASGIAMGLASSRVIYVENDSGDAPRFFALDARSGATLATYTVPGANNVDWEDIAVARDAAGVPSVWLADIGDNNAVRSEIAVYRVDEPHLDLAGGARRLPITAPDVWRLRYPDGAADAESLAVGPGGTGYLVTKSATGASSVYRLPARPNPRRVQTMRRIGSVQFGLTGTPGPFAPFGELSATSAALSRDGTLFALRTYTDAYLWRVRGGDLAGALTTPPVRVALPRQPQGEGIALDGPRLVIDSEGEGTAVYAVPLPGSVRSGGAPSTASAPSVPNAVRSASTARPRRGRAPAWLMVASGLAATVVLLLALRRRRRVPG